MIALTSPRFLGNATLTACLNGMRTMPPGNGTLPETDTATVQLVQRALVDLGYLRSCDEADGVYGARTFTAVSQFKADRGLTPSDGIVGPKTSMALDAEFPAGSLDAGPFAAMVAANRLDMTIAGLLNRLSRLTSVPWAPQMALFAHRELLNNNLAGIVRASRASDLRTHIPVSEHSALDAAAAALAVASPLHGPFATTTRFEQPSWVRAFLLVQDVFVE
jgi:peptidoglycan hydrolase-like protein with peptidoglycan-binding domain